jgi:predicted metalloprotease
MLSPVRRSTVAHLGGLLLVFGLVAACGSTDPGLTARRSNEQGNIDLPDPGGTTPPPSSVEPNPSNAAIDFGTNKTPQPYDDFLQASLADIQDYWRETFPQVYGSPFEGLQGGIWASYPDRAESLPQGCPSSPDEQYVAQGNAFYCSVGDYIVYDDFDLIPAITKLYGDSAVGVVFAHEFGHAIQTRVNALPEEPVIYREQQADCFAGAWTAHVARGESPTLRFGDDDVTAGLLAMVLVKDNVLGLNVFEGNAHGTAFDRVGAFEQGFIGGASACQQMEVNRPPLLNLQFTDQTDLAQQGNLPYDKINTDVVGDLERFWTQTFANQVQGHTFTAPTITSYPHNGPFPTCEGIDESRYPFNALYCPATNEILYDEDYARTLYNKVGDFAVGYILSNAYSDAVQTQLDSDLTGEPRSLLSDCLTGAWTRDTIPPPSGEIPEDHLIVISPGDLDEAVSTALLIGDTGSSDNQVGSAFDKIDSFRAGVLGGIDECNKRLTGG